MQRYRCGQCIEALCAARHSSSKTRAPVPLRLMSWGIDGSERAHQRWQRRLPIEKRLIYIVKTIAECAPDVLVVQDSSPLLAAALARVESSSLLTEQQSLDFGIRHIHQIHSAQEAGHADEAAACSDTAASRDRTSFLCVGSAHNGRFGPVEVYVRKDAPWEAALLQTAGPGVTVRLQARSDSATALTLTGLDLSYRGKSLGLHDGALGSGNGDRDRSPYTLGEPEASDRGSAGTGAAAAQTPPDKHRLAALDFVARTQRPDIVVGNVFMSHLHSDWRRPQAGPSFADYTDVWETSGQTAAHAHTTVFRPAKNRLSMESNHFYFTSPREEKDHISHSSDHTDSNTLSLDSVWDGAAWRLASAGNQNGGDGAVSTSTRDRTPRYQTRSQRCFVLRSGGRSRGGTGGGGIGRLYRKTRVIVPKPSLRVRGQEGAASADDVRCSVSDQYPLMALFE